MYKYPDGNGDDLLDEPCASHCLAGTIEKMADKFEQVEKGEKRRNVQGSDATGASRKLLAFRKVFRVRRETSSSTKVAKESCLGGRWNWRNSAQQTQR